ncbi:MAG: histidine phosphatase family protein [Thermovirgaceae bacterium]|nr:histidine phosphatase family protein [Thermovirgaceae bacterium]
MVNKQTVFLVRHGRTTWAESGRHTGRTDIPLSPEGRKEAAILEPVFEKVDICLVLSSPLKRAFETCEIAGLSGRARKEPDLMEWDYGKYEGLTTREISEKVPNWSVFTHPVPGGENIEEVALRADRMIARIRLQDGNIVVFSHGHFLRVMASRWLGMDPSFGKFFPLGTSTLSVFDYEHEYPVIRTWNGPLLTSACAVSRLEVRSPEEGRETIEQNGK